MLFKKVKDLKIRELYKKNEILSKALKFSSINFLNKHKKLSFIITKCSFENNKESNYSKTKIVRRCILTNRSRSSLRFIKISRLKLRELAQFGILPGCKKAV